MINDFGSAVLPEITDIPRLEPQGEWLPRPLQEMLFFHIVHKQPGGLLTRPVRDGGQARADECAIVPHIVRHVSLDGNYVLVNLSRAQPGGVLAQQSFLLPLNALPWKTLIRMRRWEPEGAKIVIFFRFSMVLGGPRGTPKVREPALSMVLAMIFGPTPTRRTSSCS